MAHGGSALGRYDGRAIFVPYGIPGERVRVRLTRDKGRFAHAEIVEVLKPSAARITPRCKHFGQCGGCHWQHIDYPAQLEFKRQVVAEQLARIGGFRDATVHPTISSPQPWAYRSHASFHVTTNGRLGFVTAADQTVQPIDECHIIRPELLEMQRALDGQDWGNIDRIRLQVGSDGGERLAAGSAAGGAVEASLLLGSRVIHYTVKGRTFQVTGGSFFQVNLSQAETLVDLVLERLALKGTENVLELYSGVGLFTVFLAGRAAQVTAVEGHPPAVRDARANLAAFTNVTLVEGTVEDVLARLDGRYEAAVLDPPRAGIDAQALDTLVKTAPAKLVYVSCDPATLARDARRLADDGYQLLDVQPVDMFPQTYHIEAVAAFVKT